jgi:hypothetical protein
MMKMKTLAAAIAFAAAGTANASIDLANTGDGSLVLTAWDNVAQESYIRDLGMNLSQFQAAAVTPDAGLTQMFAADPVFSSLFGNNTASNIFWNITAADGTGTGNQRQLLGTAALGTLTTAISVSSDGVANVANNIFTPFFNNANNQTGPDGFSCSTRASCISTDTGDLQYAGDSSWGGNWGNGAAGWQNAGTLGQSLGFYSANTLSAGLGFNQATKVRFENAYGLASLTLAAVGAVTYSIAGAPVSTVPVPAAAWLMGSGLLGLVGVARRRIEK